jgi:hypothetical protein
MFGIIYEIIMSINPSELDQVDIVVNYDKNSFIESE